MTAISYNKLAKNLPICHERARCLTKSVCLTTESFIYQEPVRSSNARCNLDMYFYPNQCKILAFPSMVRKDVYNFRLFKEVFSYYFINKMQFTMITGPADIASDTEVYSLIKIASSV